MLRAIVLATVAAISVQEETEWIGYSTVQGMINYELDKRFRKVDSDMRRQKRDLAELKEKVDKLKK